MNFLRMKCTASSTRPVARRKRHRQTQHCKRMRCTAALAAIEPERAWSGARVSDWSERVVAAASWVIAGYLLSSGSVASIDWLLDSVRADLVLAFLAEAESEAGSLPRSRRKACEDAGRPRNKNRNDPRPSIMATPSDGGEDRADRQKRFGRKVSE